MKRAALIAIALAGCAPVTSEGLSQSAIDLSIPSRKAPRDFATCVANGLPDTGPMLNEGEHYWFARQIGGAAFERWDFQPAPGGSVADRRSGRAMKSYGAGKVRECAS